MTRTRFNSLPCALTCSLCLACSSAKEPDPPPPITYQEAPKPALPTSSERPPTAAELPIAEDFDDESAEQINADNFRTELDRLEAEINADSPQLRLSPPIR